MAQRAEVIIYTISTSTSNTEDRGDKVLKKLAENTGARIFNRPRARLALIFGARAARLLRCHNEGERKMARLWNRKTALLAGASLAACFAAASPAYAQEEPAAAAAQQDEETIVVTATKRETTLLEVPFSINAQTEEDIQRLGAGNLEDLSRNVAGLNVQNLGPGQSQVSIRGVSAGQIIRDQPGVKEQVGVYLDESVISLSLFQPDLDLFESIIGQFPRERGWLLPALQAVQHAIGYLPAEALTAAGTHLRVPASEVYGVATHYPEFRLGPRGRHAVRACTGVSCALLGGRALLDAIARRYQIEPGGTPMFVN